MDSSQRESIWKRTDNRLDRLLQFSQICTRPRGEAKLMLTGLIDTSLEGRHDSASRTLAEPTLVDAFTPPQELGRRTFSVQ